MASIVAPFSSPIPTAHLRPTAFCSASGSLLFNHRCRPVTRSLSTSRKLPVGMVVRASAEDQETAVLPDVADQPVSVPVSPSDVLTMFFQAEGTMSETAIPTVTKALEVVNKNPNWVVLDAGGITNLRVQVLEGIASVELTKQTTIQATGVASSLIEIIQGSGFKLQTLNLSFEDKEEVVATH